MQSSLVIIKPDAVKRNIIGNILSIYEANGLRITKLKMLTPSLKQAEQHYGEHKGKSFYDKLISYITSGPIVLALVEGEDAVDSVRNLNGATNPADAQSETIRALYGIDKTQNSVHASDSFESVERETAIWFEE
ncbi:MAG: nucleoside-diphosphate kinase [Alkalibacterium sp.]|nr:nucleoside-diphosphate kinase [Alkalibacterium sp.]